DQSEDDAQHDQTVTDIARDDAAERAAEELPIQQGWPRMYFDRDVVRLASIPVGDVHGRHEGNAQVVKVYGRGLGAAVDRGALDVVAEGTPTAVPGRAFGGGGGCNGAWTAGHQSRYAHPAEPLRDHIHQRCVDREAGDNGKQFVVFDMSLIDGDEEEFLAIKNETAKLITAQVRCPRGKAERFGR